jgi:hypothetical protein
MRVKRLRSEARCNDASQEVGMLSARCFTLALALCLWPRDESHQGRMRVEPGREWIYEGRVTTVMTGKPETRGEFTVRCRYLALDRTVADETRLLFLQSIEPGSYSFDGQEEKTEKYEGALFLTLGRDLRIQPESGARSWSHPATLYLEFVPFPPTDAPSQPGERSVTAEPTKMSVSESFPGGAIWTAAMDEGGVRIARLPKSLPAPCACDEKETVLEACRESYLVDRATGETQQFERAWKEQGSDIAWTGERTVSLHLVESRTLPADELAARRTECERVTSLRKRIAAEGSDLEALGKEVDALPAKLEGSPLIAGVADLRRAIEQENDSRAAREKERVARERLVGKPALDFTAVDLDGHEVTLSKLHGKVVLLNFWASW